MQETGTVEKLEIIPGEVKSWLKRYSKKFATGEAMADDLGMHYNTLGPIMNGKKKTCYTSTLEKLKNKMLNKSDTYAAAS